jgi:hypothetical protein
MKVTRDKGSNSSKNNTVYSILLACALLLHPRGSWVLFSVYQNNLMLETTTSNFLSTVNQNGQNQWLQTFYSKF